MFRQLRFADYYVKPKLLRCNDICEYLNLPKFELHESEENAQSREAIEKSLTNLTRVLSEVTKLGRDISKPKIQKRIAVRKRNISSDSCDSCRYSESSYLDSIRHRIRLLYNSEFIFTDVFLSRKIPACNLEQFLSSLNVQLLTA